MINWTVKVVQKRQAGLSNWTICQALCRAPLIRVFLETKRWRSLFYGHLSWNTEFLVSSGKGGKKASEIVTKSLREVFCLRTCEDHISPNQILRLDQRLKFQKLIALRLYQTGKLRPGAIRRCWHPPISQWTKVWSWSILWPILCTPFYFRPSPLLF